MKIQFILCIAISALTGCGTTIKTLDGMSVSDITTGDIYQAKIALCDNAVSYEQVTHFVGNERTLSPEQRKSEKDRVWNKWISDRENTKENLSSKVYSIEIPIEFGGYDEQRQSMRQKDGSIINAPYRNPLPTHLVGATPDNILYNPIPINFFGYSGTIPEGASSRWFWDYFSQNYSPRSFPDTYVINDRADTVSHIKFRSRDGGYNKVYSDTKEFGIFIDGASKWISSQQSPIFKEDGIVYLNLKKFDFVDVFGVYPDTGNVYVWVSYLYEITGCRGKTPQGIVKEVIIKATHEVDGSEKEIARVRI